jgi:hypothetical protein
MYCPYCKATFDGQPITCPVCEQNISLIYQESDFECDICHNDFPDGAMFCPHCGAEKGDHTKDESTMIPQNFRTMKANNKIAEESGCKLCPEKFCIGEDIVQCENCSSYFHQKCWNDNGGCNQLSCKGKTKPCPACGEQIKENALKCWHCGHYLDTSIASASDMTLPKNWLTESILVTFFCCTPFGIAAWVNAAKVKSRFNSGDYVGAERAAKQAATYTKVSFWLGLSYLIIRIIMTVANK